MEIKIAVKKHFTHIVLEKMRLVIISSAEKLVGQRKFYALY